MISIKYVENVKKLNIVEIIANIKETEEPMKSVSESNVSHFE